MKTALTVVFATILVAFACTSEAVDCPQENGPLVTILPNPEDCKTFYICNTGIPFLMHCGEGLEFNAIKSVCDFPEHANCHSHRPSTSSTVAPPSPTDPTIAPSGTIPTTETRAP